MAKNITVVVPDKAVTIDGESHVCSPWNFGDDAIWAIQWDDEKKTGDIEPNPPGTHTTLGASDYDSKVKPYVDAWTTAKAAAKKAFDDYKAEEAVIEARQRAARTEGEKLGNTPRLPHELYSKEKTNR